LFRQASALQKRKLLERDPKAPNDRVYRLSEEGRVRALGGRDPVAQWSRHWDGKWRLVVFDIPNAKGGHREKLRRYLRGKSFGCLQRSVWVTPEPLAEQRTVLAEKEINVKSLILLEAHPCAGESDMQIVAGAWDFNEINKGYAHHLHVLDQRPKEPLKDIATAKTLQRWASEEFQAWLAAVSDDPLLPQRLLPEGYLGRAAFERRLEVFAAANQQIKGFDLTNP
jgi:phenylacetic acid degradation operon negative regulatory protein